MEQLDTISPDQPTLKSQTICVEDLLITRTLNIGLVLFCSLFETHPDVQDVFMPFKGMSKEDLSHSSQLRSHALRVMGTVEKCLSRIDEPKKLEEMLHELGARHVMYSAKVDYIDVSIPSLLPFCCKLTGSWFNA